MGTVELTLELPRWTELELATALNATVYFAIAYVLALPIAWNRERHHQGAGLRTFPLVAVASCAFTLIGLRAMGNDADAMSRVVEGIITGIGFVGGGAILKSDHRVEGTATAASIWGTGAIGVAVGFGFLELAVVLSVLTLITFMLLRPIKRRIRRTEDESYEE